MDIITTKGTAVKLSLSHIIDIFHKSGVSVGSSLPVMLSARNGNLRMTAFKDSVYCMRKLACGKKDKLSVCVDGILLKKLPLPAGEIVMSIKENRLDIKLPRMNYSLPILDNMEIAIPEVKNYFEVPTEVMASAFKSISLTPRQIQELDIKLTLSKKRLTLETVDFPYVGAVCSVKLKSKLNKDISVTIPSSFMKTMLKLGDKKVLAIHASSKNFSFVSDETTIVQPGRQVSLPDIKESIKLAKNEKPIASVTAYTKSFKEQLDLCTKFRGKTTPVLAFKLTFNKKKASIVVISDIEANGEIDIAGGPKSPVSITLSTDYTVDIINLLAGIKDEKVGIMSWSNKVLFTSGGTSFIMPLMEESAAGS